MLSSLREANTMALSIGQKVKRNTTDYLSNEIGEIIEIDEGLGRARVKWPDKRTWFKLERLIAVSDA
jgi:hypothetical protein